MTRTNIWRNTHRTLNLFKSSWAVFWREAQKYIKYIKCSKPHRIQRANDKTTASPTWTSCSHGIAIPLSVPVEITVMLLVFHGSLDKGILINSCLMIIQLCNLQEDVFLLICRRTVREGVYCRRRFLRDGAFGQTCFIDVLVAENNTRHECWSR